MKTPAMVLVSALLLAACGKNTAATNGTEQTNPQVESRVPDPCALLVSRDLEEVIGEQVVNTETAPSEDPNIAQCTFDTSAFAGRVALVVSRHESEEETRAALQPEAPGSEAVGGLGDEAYLVASSGQYDLKVRKGMIVVRLSLVTDDPSGPDKIKALAAKALPRI